MKNTYLLVIIIAIILVAGIFLVKSSNIIGNSDGNSDSNKIQKVTLSMRNSNYYPQTITVEVNEPVRIYLDSGVSGCYRAFTIRELGVSKYLEYPTDYVEFTPTKKGTFGFACSMGMGTGTLIVK